MNELERFVPPEMVEEIKSHRCYSTGSKAVVTRSDDSRLVTDNRKSCITKRQNMLKEVAEQVIRKEGRSVPYLPPP